MQRTPNYSNLAAHALIPEIFDGNATLQPAINERNSKKINPSSPPSTISDKTGRLRFQIVELLREGASTSVYEVQNLAGKHWACKVVKQASLTTKRTKAKLYASIRINSSLYHPNIVDLWTCFEDNENVYMMLGLCSSDSLKDMLRHRRCLTDPETRFFMVQLIGACYYIHTHRVVHRNLTLDNILLDENMNLKVGNFGMATLVDNTGDRRAIYGSSLYFEPGILFDTAHQPDFETDLRSIGIILYTLVVGDPPFEKRHDDIRRIHPRFQATEYEFPDDRTFSPSVQHLVSQILAPNASKSPALRSIVDHAFFTLGPVPSSIPTSSLHSPPNFQHIPKYDSDNNLKRIINSSFLNVDYNWWTPSKADSNLSQRHMQFQQIIQPGSPISALLEMAKRPLFSPAIGGGLHKEYSQSKGDLTLGIHVNQGIVDSEWTGAVEPGIPAIRGFTRMEALREEDGTDQRGPMKEKEPERTAARQTEQTNRGRGDLVPALTRSNSTKNRIAAGVKKLMNIPQIYFPSAFHFGFSLSRTSTPSPRNEPDLALKLSKFDAIAQTLAVAFEANAAGRLLPGCAEALLLEEKVFIDHCVDNSMGFKVGYSLTDGSIGMMFNDDTTLVQSPDRGYFDYLSLLQADNAYLHKSFTVNTIPEELKSKTDLLEQFEKRNIVIGDYTFKDVARPKGMKCVQKYFRTAQASVFILSQNVVQFNFSDNSILLLSSGGDLVTYIDECRIMTRRTVRDVMNLSIRSHDGPPQSIPSRPTTLQQDLAASALNQRIFAKLELCMDAFKQISGLGYDAKPAPPIGTHESLKMTSMSIYSGASTFYSKASSRTASTDYGLFYTRRAFSQDNLTAMSLRGSRVTRV